MSENYWKQLANERNARKAAEAANDALRLELARLQARIDTLEAAALAAAEPSDAEASNVPESVQVVEESRTESTSADP